MFGNKSELKRQIKGLKDDKEKLETDISKLKSQHKIEEQEIEHLIKLKESKLDLEFKEKVMNLEAEHQTKLNTLQNEYNGKLQKQLEKEATRTQEMYDQILKRLPDINVKLAGKV